MECIGYIEVQNFGGSRFNWNDVYYNKNNKAITYKVYEWDSQVQHKLVMNMFEKPRMYCFPGNPIKLVFFSQPDQTNIFNTSDHDIVNVIHNMVKSYVDNTFNSKADVVGETSNVSSEVVDSSQLTPDNLVDLVVSFCKTTNKVFEDITEAIQDMLKTKKYILSDSLIRRKLSFKQVNTYFLSQVAPEKVSKQELEHLLFSNVK
jgi:hypothetical protein